MNEFTNFNKILINFRNEETLIFEAELKNWWQKLFMLLKIEWRKGIELEVQL